MEIICYMEWNYTVILNENILLYVMEYFAIWKGINCHMEWNILLYGMELFAIWNGNILLLILIYWDGP